MPLLEPLGIPFCGLIARSREGRGKARGSCCPGILNEAEFIRGQERGALCGPVVSAGDVLIRNLPSTILE